MKLLEVTVEAGWVGGGEDGVLGEFSDIPAGFLVCKIRRFV